MSFILLSSTKISHNTSRSSTRVDKASSVWINCPEEDLDKITYSRWGIWGFGYDDEEEPWAVCWVVTTSYCWACSCWDCWASYFEEAIVDEEKRF